MKLPRARTENIVEQNLDNETLIYDLTNNKAYLLNETSGIVFNHCNGHTSFDELKRGFQFTDELIYLALNGLREKNLIEENSFFSPPAGINRRDVIRKIGITSVIALPVISSLVAPSAANAASACVNVGGQAPNTVVKIGNFAGCYADCSAASVTIKCCSGSARPGVICDPGPPQRTACNCN